MSLFTRARRHVDMNRVKELREEKIKEEKIAEVQKQQEEILAGLKQTQPRHYSTILKTFLSHIRREVALQTAVVYTPTALSAQTLEEIKKQFTQKYNRSIDVITEQDDSLIAGIRVRIGDDVYDASLTGRLKQLAANIN